MSFFTPRPTGRTPTIHIRRLDLRNNDGGLKRKWLDLPGLIQEASKYLFLRQSERTWVPSSYRTGLIFFGTLMLFFLLGITAMNARSLAENKQLYLNSQLFQEFSRLSSNLENHSGENAALGFATLQKEALFFTPDSSFKRLNTAPVDQQLALVELGLQVSNGYRYFQELIHIWENSSKDKLLENIGWMKHSAENTLESWDLAEQQFENLKFFSWTETELEQLGQIENQIGHFRQFLRDFEQGADTLLSILGRDDPQRILVLIQDPHERRATGGTLSVGVELLLDEGKILEYQSFETGEFDQFLSVNLPVPASAQGRGDSWKLTTANAFLDVNRSAEQIHWFWQRTARRSLDLVLLINTTALEQFFSQSGALGLWSPEEVSKIRNIALEWSAKRSRGQAQDLKEYAEHILRSVLKITRSPDLLMKAWPAWQQALAEKQMMVVGLDPELRENLKGLNLNMDLDIPEGQDDFLMVGSMNIGADQSELGLLEQLSLHTAIGSEGQVKNWLKIKRSLSDYRSEDGYNFPFFENKSLIKVLVPKGSQLISSTGVPFSDIRIHEAVEYTEWSFELRTQNGNNSEVSLSYFLPWKFDVHNVDNYRLWIKKQAGVKSVSFDHHIKLPANLQIYQQLPEEPLTLLEKDVLISVVAGVEME